MVILVFTLCHMNNLVCSGLMLPNHMEAKPRKIGGTRFRLAYPFWVYSLWNLRFLIIKMPAIPTFSLSLKILLLTHRLWRP